jgi:hypothetical protein
MRTYLIVTSLGLAFTCAACTLAATTVLAANGGSLEYFSMDSSYAAKKTWWQTLWGAESDFGSFATSNRSATTIQAPNDTQAKLNTVVRSGRGSLLQTDSPTKCTKNCGSDPDRM